jgi:DNA-binding NarL/FixJ family response regulator
VPRVIVIAARPAVRAGLAALLGEEGIEVAGAWPALEDWPAEQLPVSGDAILIDPATGAADVEAAAALHPAQPIVVLGPVNDDGRLLAAFAGRPWGYLPRDAAGDRLAAAVRAVANGLVAIDPDLAGRVVGAPLGSASEGAGEELTPREREVLQLIALGLPNKTIASRLAISEHTVKFHVAAILSRLGAASRTEAVRIGARRGLVVL